MAAKLDCLSAWCWIDRAEGLIHHSAGVEKMPEMFRRFLSTTSADRVEHSLRTLQHHGIEEWVLTGGLAVDIHRTRLTDDVGLRQLNDIDFITTSFDNIPETLTNDFLFLHVHPFDPPGKTLVQLVDARPAIRIDVFRADIRVVARAIDVGVPDGVLRVASLEDLLARAARLTLPLADGVPVPSKHAKDFLALLKLAPPNSVERAWVDHRRSHDPATFREVATTLCGLIQRRSDLLITPKYSHNPAQECRRCVPTGRFRVADPALILSILGYC